MFGVWSLGLGGSQLGGFRAPRGSKVRHAIAACQPQVVAMLRSSCIAVVGVGIAVRDMAAMFEIWEFPQVQKLGKKDCILVSSILGGPVS